MNDLEAALARIAKTAQLANEKAYTFRGMLYGPSGGGKSTIAAMIMRTIVDKSKGDIILHVDTSEGYVSWRNHPGLSEGIMTLPFTTFEDLESIALGIKDKIAPFDKVRGIILDEGSKMAEQDVIRVLEKRRAGVYGERFQATAGAITEGADYQIALERYRKMSYMLYDNRDLHVIVCAHQSEKKDRTGAVVGYSPAFSPKIAQAVKEPLHLSAHLIGTVAANLQNPGQPQYNRVAQVHPSIMVDAKCRMNIRQTSVNADDLPRLIKSWLDEGGVQVKADDKPREEVHTVETLTSAVDGVIAEPAITDEVSSMSDELNLENIGLTAVGE